MGSRASLIRQYEDGLPLAGDKKSSWFRATEMRRQIITYYGHPKDIGNPGWKKGGPLPVQLSSFRAERTEQGALIKWTTESELENAGFNVLRSETKTGTFTRVTPRMLAGCRDDFRAEQLRVCGYDCEGERCVLLSVSGGLVCGGTATRCDASVAGACLCSEPVSDDVWEPEERGVTLAAVMWRRNCLNCDFCDLLIFCDSPRRVDAECNTRNGFRLFPDEIL